MVTRLSLGRQEEAAVDGFDDGGFAAFVSSPDELELRVEVHRDIAMYPVVTDGDLLEAHGSGWVI